MARRSDHSPEELRLLAIAAAAGIVEGQGPGALTARAVAQAIGYSPGTLYNLFANLDDLVLHLNGRTLEMLEQRLEAAPRGLTPAADVLALAEAYVAFLEAHPALWELLFRHRLPPETPLPDWFLSRIERLLVLVEVALAPLFGPGETERCREAARVLWASLHGICSLATERRLLVVGIQSATAMVAALVTHFVAGLEAGAATGGA